MVRFQTEYHHGVTHGSFAFGDVLSVPQLSNAQVARPFYFNPVFHQVLKTMVPNVWSSFPIG